MGEREGGRNEKVEKHSLRIRVPFFQQPVVQRLADGFPHVVQVVDVSRTGMRDSHL